MYWNEYFHRGDGENGAKVLEGVSHHRGKCRGGVED